MRLTCLLAIIHLFAVCSHAHGDSPAEKYAALHAWGLRFEQRHGRAPLVWIDRFCLPRHDNDDSDPNVAQLLPCYLASCSSFLALAGGSYLSRLWCILVSAACAAQGC